jgi:hypothetical protein
MQNLPSAKHFTRSLTEFPPTVTTQQVRIQPADYQKAKPQNLWAFPASFVRKASPMRGFVFSN